MTCMNTEEEGDLTETFPFPFDCNQTNMPVADLTAFYILCLFLINRLTFNNRKQEKQSTTLGLKYMKFKSCKSEVLFLTLENALINK